MAATANRLPNSSVCAKPRGEGFMTRTKDLDTVAPLRGRVRCIKEFAGAKTFLLERGTKWRHAHALPSRLEIAACSRKFKLQFAGTKVPNDRAVVRVPDA